MKVLQKMKPVHEEIARIEAEKSAMILRYDAQLDVLRSLLSKMTGQPLIEKPARTRSPNIKPLVLDIMNAAGFTGSTSSEVDEQVRAKVPTVGKDSVGSILSRLKSDGALTYDGQRYYEKQYAPRPFDANLRAVS
jgi:hypothetical protein